MSELKIRVVTTKVIIHKIKKQVAKITRHSIKISKIVEMSVRRSMTKSVRCRSGGGGPGGNMAKNK